MNIKKRIISCSLAAATILSSVGAMGITASAATIPQLNVANVTVNGVKKVRIRITNLTQIKNSNSGKTVKFYAKFYTNSNRANNHSSLISSQGESYYTFPDNVTSNTGVNFQVSNENNFRLKPNTTYYVLPVAKINGKNSYGTVQTIRTPSVANPTIPDTNTPTLGGNGTLNASGGSINVSNYVSGWNLYAKVGSGNTASDYVDLGNVTSRGTYSFWGDNYGKDSDFGKFNNQTQATYSLYWKKSNGSGSYITTGRTITVAGHGTGSSQTTSISANSTTFTGSGQINFTVTNGKSSQYPAVYRGNTLLKKCTFTAGSSFYLNNDEFGDYMPTKEGTETKVTVKLVSSTGAVVSNGIDITLKKPKGGNGKLKELNSCIGTNQGVFGPLSDHPANWVGFNKETSPTGYKIPTMGKTKFLYDSSTGIQIDSVDFDILARCISHETNATAGVDEYAKFVAVIMNRIITPGFTYYWDSYDGAYYDSDVYRTVHTVGGFVDPDNGIDHPLQQHPNGYSDLTAAAEGIQAYFANPNKYRYQNGNLIHYWGAGSDNVHNNFY